MTAENAAAAATTSLDGVLVTLDFGFIFEGRRWRWFAEEGEAWAWDSVAGYYSRHAAPARERVRATNKARRARAEAQADWLVGHAVQP